MTHGTGVLRADFWLGEDTRARCRRIPIQCSSESRFHSTHYNTTTQGVRALAAARWRQLHGVGQGALPPCRCYHHPLPSLVALVTAAPDNIHSEQQRHVAVLHPGIIELVTDYSRVHHPLLVIALVSARHHRVARVAGGDVHQTHLSPTEDRNKRSVSAVILIV